MLLEVIEANHAVDLVPVVDSGFERGVGGQTKVHSLVKQNIEEFEKEMTICEILAQVRDLGNVVLLEDLVDYHHDLLVLLTISARFFVTSWFLGALVFTFSGVRLIQHFFLKQFYLLYFIQKIY